MRNTQKIFGSIDIVCIILYLFLIIFGWTNIYASLYNDDTTISIFNLSTKYGKQLMFIGISILLSIIILIIDWRFFDSFSFILYISSIILLIWVLFNPSVNGASSWFNLGEFKFQPSEIAKCTTALALAKMFSINKKSQKSFSYMIKSYILIAIPMFLIILQNDLGTAIIFTSFILVFYREGLSGNVLIIILIASLLCILSLLINYLLLIIITSIIITLMYFYNSKRNRSLKISIALTLTSIMIIMGTQYTFKNILAPHHVERINITLGKEIDPMGAGYNLLQSKIAIGSGEWSGKGFLNGTQTRFDFVPEQSTDFIFCTIGEEWGFLGSLIFIIIFMSLLLRIIYLAEKQKSQFSRVYGYSLACILFTHLFINIGMTIGLAPVIGIPLPFISYGGSSLIGFTALLFIFLNLDSHRMDILR